MPESNDDAISFADLGLDEITLEAIKKKGFVTPSPIQQLAIPRLLSGEANVIARARTGTGKTAAFGLPLVQTLREDKGYVRAIILEPTRELAMQTCTELSSFTTGKFPRNTVVYGGASMGEQIRALKRGAEIVTGTPGRVQDLMERGVLDISKIEYFILDEGDEMLDMGFVDDIEKIFSEANPECRVLLFSATIPKPILKIAEKFMGEYEIVEEEGVVEEPLLIDQKYWVLRPDDKIEALVRLIDMTPDFYGIVFVQKKTDADYVSRALDEKGYEVAALHGDIPQSQREKILARFRNGKTRIVVATDVAARGIDIEGLTHVVNYELPFDGATYVHRIGRTGRAGSSGTAVTFVTPQETRRKLRFLIQAVKRNAKGEIKEGKVPSVPEVLEVKKERLFSRLKEKLQNCSSSEDAFSSFAQELCSENEPVSVLASLLKTIYGKELDESRYSKIGEASSKMSSSRNERRTFVSENQMRLYVQMGWHDGYNPKKIADFFSKLLHIRGKDVDAIDMADKFCLLTLPVEAAKKALSLSKDDMSLPHMHQDSKSAADGFKESGRRSYRDRGARNGGRASSFKERGFSRQKPGVHTATKRNSKAAIYKKSRASDEY
ncbi:MAG: DEAD/DEAH box helicase [Treponema sp.]|nr:DEAD/DEAH box helicase [Treponema sp.]